MIQRLSNVQKTVALGLSWNIMNTTIDSRSFLILPSLPYTYSYVRKRIGSRYSNPVRVFAASPAALHNYPRERHRDIIAPGTTLPTPRLRIMN